ncbi:hypothetical protein F4556_001148 [Kitasatospora gansuensis]|uniref:Uncharacterized protein n=1 Tax=Kitasatospora gansuensis TaxID=258050 RepID=A0A7W7WG58_9ACTN|nr:hypothetical protein [Kitasatospora gansuensis]MBB4945613.1 hypothetical protein [Kitasatospora gansuensis]
MRVRRAGGADGGSIGVFVAICAAGLVLMIGVVLEAGGRLRAIETADAQAQEAARVIGQQLDETALLRGDGYLLARDVVAARSAADAYLAPSGLHAEVTFVGGRTVVVDIRAEYRTTLLGAISVRSLEVHGRGSATLVHGVKEAETA